MAVQKLYVVFHGLIALVHEIGNRRVRALLLNMPGHRVAVGHWLTEHDIPSGVVLTPTGLDTAGTDFLDPTQNMVVQNATLDLGASVYAEIDLPLPEKVYSLCPQNMSGLVTGETAKVSSLTFHAVQVFQYTMTSDTLTLSGGGFTFTSQAGLPMPSLADRLVVVHVLNEPPSAVDDPHSREEFALGASALGVALMLGKPPLFPNPAGPPPKGMLLEEVFPLVIREFTANFALFRLRNSQLPAAASAIGGHKVCGTVSATVA